MTKLLTALIASLFAFAAVAADAPKADQSAPKAEKKAKKAPKADQSAPKADQSAAAKK